MTDLKDFDVPREKDAEAINRFRQQVIRAFTLPLGLLFGRRPRLVWVNPNPPRKPNGR